MHVLALQALVLAGKVDQAREVFTTALTVSNDLGLMAEEVDSRTGQVLGHLPPVVRHVGPVTAAYAIAERTARTASDGRPVTA